MLGPTQRETEPRAEVHVWGSARPEDLSAVMMRYWDPILTVRDAAADRAVRAWADASYGPRLTVIPLGAPPGADPVCAVVDDETVDPAMRRLLRRSEARGELEVVPSRREARVTPVGGHSEAQRDSEGQDTGQGASPLSEGLT